MKPNEVQRVSKQVATVDFDWIGGDAGNFRISNLELLVLTTLLDACFVDDDDFKGEKALMAAIATIVNDDIAKEPIPSEVELYPRSTDHPISLKIERESTNIYMQS